MKTDYIIVGCGLAGIAFCEELKANNKTFVVFDNNSQQSSTVAGGMYNPVVLKRFTGVWKSKEQLALSIPVYNNIEKELDQTFDYKIPVHRLFNNIQEQNKWFTASDKPNLSDYLSTTLLKSTNPNINAPFGYGEVLQTGRVNTKKLVSAYRKDLANKSLLITEAFNYNELKTEDNKITYKNREAKHIIFAEGYGLKSNPFFKELPLEGLKGELITIKAPNLKLTEVIKSSLFIMPLGNDLYRIGATFDRDNKDNKTTEAGKQQLIDKLKPILNCSFEVVNHTAGIRPTVSDRRPLVGTHHTFKNYHILNGLGTRGVMIAPFVAKALFNAIENNIALDSEFDISRFIVD